MLSAQQPVNFQPPANLFNEFFKLLRLITTVVNVTLLEKVDVKLKQFEDQHHALDDVFKPENIATNPNPPTLEQIALHKAETSMLHMLRVVYARKLQKFGRDIDITKYEADVKYLRYQLDNTIKQPFPLLHAIQLLTTIFIEILMLQYSDAEMDDNAMTDFISMVMTIMDCIGKYKQSFPELNAIKVANIDNQVLEDLQCSAYVLLYDTDTKNHRLSFVGSIADIFVKKLIKVHERLEVRQRNIAAKSMSSYEYQRVCYQLTSIDSVTRRLNMHASPTQREAFNTQAKRYRRHHQSFDIRLWCNNTTADNLYLFLSTTIERLFERFDALHDLDCCLQVLKEAKVNKDLKSDQIIMLEVENILHQARLIKQHSCELSAERLADESDIAFQLRCLEQQQLNNSISLIITKLTGFLLGMSVDRALPIHINIWTKIQLDMIREIRNEIRDFSDVETELINLTTIMLFVTRFGLKHAAEKDPQQRENIVGEVATHIAELPSEIIKPKNPLTRKQIIFARQFILDYYFSALLICKNNAESRTLLATGLQKIILLQMQGLENAPIYQVINTILIRIKQSGIPLDEVDEGFFARFDENERLELLKLCKAAIHRINVNEYRVSTSLKVFAIKYMTMFLNSSKKAGKNHNLAKNALKDLNDYYKSLTGYERRTIEKIKVDYEPARFTVGKSSFLKEETIPVANKTVPTIEEKAPVKVEEAPAVQAKVPTFNLFAAYDDNLKILNNDYDALFQEYDKVPLEGRKHQHKLFALLGLAQHLQYMTDDHARQSVMKKLIANASAVFDSCRSTMFDDEWENAKRCYEDFIKPWQVRVEPQKKSLPVAKPVVVEAKTEAPQPPKRRFRKQYKYYPPRTYTPTPSVTKVSMFPAKNDALMAEPIVDNPDPYHEIRKPINVLIAMSAMQEAFYDEMAVAGFLPLIQGGAVQDTMFGIPHRDIDYLAIASYENLEKFLNANKERFHISHFHKIKESNVILVQFDTRFVDVNDEVIELAYLNANDKKQIPDELRKFTLGFGIKTVFSDKQFLIDPLNQFPRSQLEAGKLSLEQLLCADVRVDLSAYFKKWPARIFDCLYKVAKYQKYGYTIPITFGVQASINDARENFLAFLDKGLTDAQFNKLFLRGFATESFDVFNKESMQFAGYLFPQLSPKNLDKFRVACVNTDARMLKDEYKRMTRVTREILRAKLISETLYDEFMSHQNTEKLSGDKTELDKSCAQFLSSCRFHVSDELINRVQKLWWDTLTNNLSMGSSVGLSPSPLRK